MRKTLVALALAGAYIPAQATLLFVDKIDLSGTGLGAVPTILTIQSPNRTSTEEGAVFANGTSQKTSGDTQAQNHLRTFAELGYTEAAQIRIVFNPNEPQNATDGTIRLESLVLSIFDPAGKTVFSSGPITPLDVNATDAGTGKSGFLFRLDQTQASLAESAIDTNGGNEGLYRIGLSARATNATGGNETFFAQSAVPEPGAYAMLGLGLGLLGVVARRRHMI